MSSPKAVGFDFSALKVLVRADRDKKSAALGRKVGQGEWGRPFGLSQTQVSKLERGTYSEDIPALVVKALEDRLGPLPRVDSDSGRAQGPGTNPAPPPDTALHSLVPEEVLANPTHQVLWRRLAFIWKRRNENPGLFSVVDLTMAQWELQFGGTAQVAEDETVKRPTKKKHVRSDNLSGTVTAR